MDTVYRKSLESDNRRTRRLISLRWHFVFYIGVPLLIIYCIMIYFHYRYGRDRAIDNQEKLLLRTVTSHAKRTDVHFKYLENSANAALDIFWDMSDQPISERMDTAIRMTLDLNPDAYAAGFAFAEHKYRSDVQFFVRHMRRDMLSGQIVPFPDSGENYLSAEWFRSAQEQRRGKWSKPYSDPLLGGVWLCTYSAPVKQDSEFLGVFFVSVSIESIIRNFSGPAVDLGRNSYYVIIDTDADFVAHPNPKLVEDRGNLFKFNADLLGVGQWPLAIEDFKQKRSVVRPLPNNHVRGNQTVYTASAYVPSVDWMAYALTPEQVFLEPAETLFHIDFLLAGIGLAIMLTVAGISVGRLTRPLRDAVKMAADISRGDFSRTVEAPSQLELAVLVYALTDMAKSLESHSRKLRGTVEDLDGILRKVAVAALELGQVGNHVESSSNTLVVGAIQQGAVFEQFSGALSNMQEFSNENVLLAESAEEMMGSIIRMAAEEPSAENPRQSYERLAAHVRDVAVDFEKLIYRVGELEQQRDTVANEVMLGVAKVKKIASSNIDSATANATAVSQLMNVANNLRDMLVSFNFAREREPGQDSNWPEEQ